VTIAISSSVTVEAESCRPSTAPSNPLAVDGRRFIRWARRELMMCSMLMLGFPERTNRNCFEPRILAILFFDMFFCRGVAATGKISQAPGCLQPAKRFRGRAPVWGNALRLHSKGRLLLAVRLLPVRLPCEACPPPRLQQSFYAIRAASSHFQLMLA